MNDHPLASSLTDVSVVQVGHRPSNFVLRILGDLGAQVSQVVVSDGSSSEATGTPTHEAHYTAGVNVIRVSEVEEVLAEISRHDVVINSCQGETSVPLLDARQIEQINSSNSRAILCHVTPYGAFGPWSERPASDLTLLASGGFLGSSGYDDGAEAGLPIAATGGQTNHVTGMIASVAILGALMDRQQEPEASGRAIDISAQHALAVSTEMAVPFWDYTEQEVVRHTGRHAMPRDTPRWQHPCQDGKHLLALPLYIDDRRFEALKKWMEDEGFAHGLDDEKYRKSETRELHMFDVVDAIRNFASTKDSGWMFTEAQKRKLPWAPVNNPFECVDDTHFTKHRTTVESVRDEHQVVRRARLPFLVNSAESEVAK